MVPLMSFSGSTIQSRIPNCISLAHYSLLCNSYTKTLQLKTTNIYCLIVSVGQEFRSCLGGSFLVRVSDDVEFMMSTRTALAWKRTISPKSPEYVYWRMELKNYDLDIGRAHGRWRPFSLGLVSVQSRDIIMPAYISLFLDLFLCVRVCLHISHACVTCVMLYMCLTYMQITTLY